jgi:FkbM family methyltransferase
MMKQSIQKALGLMGYQIVNLAKAQEKQGLDYCRDMARIFGARHPKVMIDVGANEGQTAKRLSAAFPSASVHSFEPSPATYRILAENCKHDANIKTWNHAVGSACGSLEFHENSYSDMSSALRKTDLAWGEEVSSISVPVRTLDSFAEEQGIAYIDVLKSDTQGFDLEVFRGAERLLDENRIGLIFFEITFMNLYVNLPEPGELFRYLESKNFRLAGIYDLNYRSGLLGWSDFLFLHNGFARDLGF